MEKSTKTKKTKKYKRKSLKITTIIIFILLVAFVAYCYFNPDFYNSLLDFINGGNDNLITEIQRENYHAQRDEDMVVHFIDIGQGDAIFIEFPDEKNMLIDAGDYPYKNDNKLLGYLNDLNVETIDYVIATHADADHIGGMGVVFENFCVKKVYRPYVYYSGKDYSFDDSYNKGSDGYNQRSKAYGIFLNGILNETYEESGQTYSCEWEFFTYTCDFGTNIIYDGKTTPYTVDFLSPSKKLSQIEYKDANDYSPIIKISYGDYDMMFTGDAETECEIDFVNSYSAKEEYKLYVDVELLKVGHHGSRTSSQDDFLKLILPEVAIITCGKGNDYGHPHKETLDRLVKYNSTIYRTDNNGDIRVSVDSSGKAKIEPTAFSTENHLPPS